MDVFDIECDIPTKEVFEVLLDDVETGRLDQGMTNYLNIFGPQWAALIGMDAEKFEETKRELGQEAVFKLILTKLIDSALSDEAFIEMLDAAGVKQACIGTGWFASIEHTASLACKYPDRLIPWLRISPFEGMAGVARLEKCVKEMGFKGFEVSPFRENIYANDKKYYPFYGKCVELGIPIRSHTAMNYDSEKAMDLGHPFYLDQVARDFPELTIIAGLGGWPWVPDLVGLARRHRRIYIDLAAHRPKHIPKPGSGFEMLLQFGNSLLQDKILFASSWMTLGLSMSQIIEEMGAIPLKDSVRKKWMYDNAASILNR
jgi:predicted TIM-barrel fold metal-dependent hydrolase